MTSVVVPVLTLAGIGAIAIERRLAVTFKRPISIFATLGLLVSAPILAGSAATGLMPSTLFAAGAVAFALLPTGIRGRRDIVRGLVVAILAIGPTVFLVARSPWREAYPEALLTALFGGQGLLYGGPLLWAGFLGLRALPREDRALRNLCLWALVPGVAGLTIGTEDADTALRSATWLPFLAPGLAASLGSLERLTTRRPARVLVALGLLLAGWNALFMEQYRRLLIPNDNTASFAHITANSARLLSEAVGTPMAWPANWIFAARTGVASGMWDGAAGRRLFVDATAEATTIEIGDDASALAPDLPLLGRGFGPRRTCERGWCRDVYDTGTLLLPLQNPGAADLIIRVSARGEGVLRLSLDRPAASVVHELGASIGTVPLRVAARLVRPGIHVLTLEVPGGGKATLDRITIERTLDASSATARRR